MEEDIYVEYIFNSITKEEAFDKLRNIYPTALEEDILLIINYWNEEKER